MRHTNRAPYNFHILGMKGLRNEERSYQQATFEYIAIEPIEALSNFALKIKSKINFTVLIQTCQEGCVSPANNSDSIWYSCCKQWPLSKQ